MKSKILQACLAALAAVEPPKVGSICWRRRPMDHDSTRKSYFHPDRGNTRRSSGHGTGDAALVRHRNDRRSQRQQRGNGPPPCGSAQERPSCSRCPMKSDFDRMEDR